jgi:hypothetical protein
MSAAPGYVLAILKTAAFLHEIHSTTLNIEFNHLEY